MDAPSRFDRGARFFTRAPGHSQDSIEPLGRFAGALLGVLLLTAAARPLGDDAGAAPTQDTVILDAQHGESVSVPMRASELLGQAVHVRLANGTGHKSVGKVQDLLVELDRGQLSHVIVQTGGVGDVGDTLRAFPMQSLTRVPREGAAPELVLALTVEEFQNTASVDARDLGAFRGEIIATQGFGREKPPEQFRPRDPVVLLSDVTQLRVGTAEVGSRVAEARDAWLELGSGRIEFLELAVDEEIRLMPLTLFITVAEPKARVLRLSLGSRLDTLASAPRVDPATRSAALDPRFVRRVREHFEAREGQMKLAVAAPAVPRN